MTNPTRYRYRDLKPGDAYYDAWRRYDRFTSWVALSVVIPVGGIAAMFVVGRYLPLGEVAAEAIAFSLFGYFVFAMIIALATGAGWPCPRCNKMFFTRISMSNLDGSHCAHCNLPKFAPDDPDKESADD